MKVKIKNLRIKDIVKQCQKNHGCYECPLTKLGTLCNGYFGYVSEEKLNQEVEI